MVKADNLREFNESDSTIGVCYGAYLPIAFRLDTMILDRHNTMIELYRLMPLSMTLTFVQGHWSTRNFVQLILILKIIIQFAYYF